MVATDPWTRLLGGILTDSVWTETPETRCVWLALVALMEPRTGRVAASVPGLARIAGVPITAVQAALAVLTEPDPHNRCQDEEGRRLTPVADGWIVVGAGRIQELRETEKRRDRARESTRRWRDRLRHGESG